MNEDDGSQFTGRQVEFILPYATLLLNRTARIHWSKLGRIKKRMAWEIRLQTQGKRPPEPFRRALVEIDRYSAGSPDEDGLIGGLKMLIDCLLPEGKPFLRKGKWVLPHPGGQAIIVDDKSSVMTLRARALKIKRGESARTTVVVREMA